MQLVTVKIIGVFYYATVIICSNCMFETDWKAVDADPDAVPITEANIDNWDKPLICEVCTNPISSHEHKNSY